ncbi:metallophosphoesterase [Megamonas hypermegale]|uniref:metallophosphoesterase n=1 Tax=Megamonas hypermegale TaxID=158847 RepID=UPI0026F18412|nr:metallophosphoesterase [Megamonas hypermegale]
MVIDLIIAAVFFIVYPSVMTKDYGGILAEITVLWFVLQLFLIILAVIVKLLRLIYEKTKGAPVDESRRRFLRGCIWVPAISGALYGGLYEKNHIEFTNIDIDAGDYTRLNRLKIAQLSDVHLGRFFSVKQLQDVLNQIIQQRADMLVLTGDIFDSARGSDNDEAIKVLNAYSQFFPFGVYFCWGNHEHYRGIEHLKEKLEKTNIQILKNAAVKVLSGDKPFYVMGVDFATGDMEDDVVALREAYVEEALATVPDNAYKILLAHHSIFIDEAVKYNINLTLTGHTHGGQFGFMGIPVFPMFKYMRGLVEQNGCIGYINRGAGSWFPFRIGCPPEVTFFNFKAKG